MKINGKEIIGKWFIWDGCHRIYILETPTDYRDAKRQGYKKNKDLLPIERIREFYEKSCFLRFINTKRLETIVPQFAKRVKWEKEK